MVLRWIANTGGAPGVEVTTPQGLALQLLPVGPAAIPDDDPDLPAGTEMARRVGARPRLGALVRRHARAAALARQVDPDVALPGWMSELLDSDWQLLQGADHGVPAVMQGSDILDWGVEHRFDRAHAIGFQTVDGVMAPWIRALVGRLGGDGALICDPPALQSLPAIPVPDVAAEARVAVAECCDDPDGALVLVADDASADRVRAALGRNGLASTQTPAQPLMRHGLGQLLGHCVAWFTGQALANVEVHAVLTSPLLGAGLPEQAVAWLTERDAHEVPSVRRIGRVLRRARLLSAPLDRWIAVVGALTEVPPADAAYVEARLRVLRACMAGATFADEFGAGTAQADWADFDALVADLLGGEAAADPVPPDGATLGSLRRFLLTSGVRAHGDPVARALLGTLRERAHWPATPPHLARALGGSVSTPDLGAGVTVLSYDDYDGRPCRKLVMLDVHGHGLLRRGLPDPLLTDAQLAAIGQRGPAAGLQFRLNQVRWACARAQQAVAVCTREDADGRPVAPPVQLPLQPRDVHIAGHGLSLTLPETARLGQLEVMDGPAPAQGPDAHTRSGHLAIQATAEWIRAGRGPAGPAPEGAALPPSEPPTLAHLLEREAAVPWVARWLGDARGVDAAALDTERSWSHAALFGHLTHCLYQAYGRAVLDLGQPDRVSEALDPREIGQAVHEVLDRATPELQRRSLDPDQARVQATKSLRTHNQPAFDEAVQALPRLSTAGRAAADGLAARWNHHWAEWAAGRVRRPAGVPDSRAVEALLDGHPAMLSAFRDLERAGAALPAVPAWRLRKWLAWAARQGPDVADYDRYPLLGIGEYMPIPDPWEPVLRAVARGKPFLAVIAAGRRAMHLVEVLRGEVQSERAELDFEVDLSLGSGPVRVTGRVDRVTAVACGDDTLLQLTDYKSGAARSLRDVRRDVVSLRLSQLPLYALALRALGEPPVAAVGYDYLRSVSNDRGQPLGATEEVLVDDDRLDVAQQALGALVDRGREGHWSLRPRRDTCPALAGPWNSDHCPLASACRLRALPEGAR